MVFNSKYNPTVDAGWRFGAGFDKGFNNNLTFSLNPYIGCNNCFKITDNINGYNTRFIKFGISLGLGYKF